MATVNAYSGAVHPLIVRHPRSGRLSLCIHLGMVGAVIRWPRVSAAGSTCGSLPQRFRQLEAMDPLAGPTRRCGHQLLTESETRTLLRTIDVLLSDPAHSITWTYSAHGDEVDGDESSVGDLVIVDNLAAAHEGRQAHRLRLVLSGNKKLQSKRMFSKKLSKRSLQQQNLLL